MDKLVALDATNIKAVEPVFLHGKAGDRQRLALRTGFLDSVITSAGVVAAVADLGYDAFEADAASVLEHLCSNDFEAFAELDGGFIDVHASRRKPESPFSNKSVISASIKRCWEYLPCSHRTSVSNSK